MANIGATTAFYKVETSLTRANSEVSKSMERLATGKANANAGDRSSYVAMADTFRLDFVGTKAGIKGASVTMGYLETGMRVLDSASSLLSRLQELAVLGANDTNTTADHEAINLEAEAIGDEFNRLMTTSTYKGRDVFNATAGSLYVSMGGRDQEMTFGIGTIDYSDMYVAEARTIAGATTASPRAFGRAVATGITGATGLEANKSYIFTTVDAAHDDTSANANAILIDAGATRIDGTDYANGDAAFTVTVTDVASTVKTSAAVANVGANELKEVVTGADAFVKGESYVISQLGASNGNTAAGDALALANATSASGTLAAGTTFTVNSDASDLQMAHLNSLVQGMTFTNVSDTAAAIDGPNKDGTFNLAHLPSDAVTVRGMGAAAEVGRVGSSGLEADKTYIIRAIVDTGAGEEDYEGLAGTMGGDVLAATSAIYDQAGGDTVKTAGAEGDMTIGDVIVMSSAVAGGDLDANMVIDEVNTSSTRFLAGHEYEIVSMGNAGDGTTATVSIASYTTDAGAIGRASSNIADSATIEQGTKFTVDADISFTNLTYLNALTEDMTFRMTTDTLTKDIEAMQGLVNTARVQAGSQYAALESAVDYTTNLTAQYELGYNTVNDVNFSMETAHLARNQILQQAATAMLAQANSGQQGLLQLIS